MNREQLVNPMGGHGGGEPEWSFTGTAGEGETRARRHGRYHGRVEAPPPVFNQGA